MTSQEFIQTLPVVIKNITDYDYKNPSTKKCWMCVKDGKVKYISLIKQNWADDTYCISFYTENKYKNISRTSSTTFSLDEAGSALRKIKNTFRNYEKITETTMNYL